MKSRQGFVSNSSSSSFVIAIKKAKSKKFSDPSSVIDFLIKHSGAKYGDLKYFSQTPKKYDFLLKKEIKELQKDVRWVEKQKSGLEEALGNEDVVEILAKINRMPSIQSAKKRNEDNANKDKTNEDNRFSREYMHSMKEALEREITSLEYSLNSMGEKIKELQEKEKKIQPYLDGDWQLIGFEEDMWGSVLKSAIEDMARRKEAIIIEKATT